ncbi:TRAP transporter large permease subunit [Miniphocaeibacter halophilus]|uniref:TRAP transporter large permease subunit n=1 Tax=Miniphocaeibacter halophilus TaxID=2931922 RepID=A0AC61MWW2_9FIRM|nr:TRAP transporter large permease subunit [Miniphocaeibacter halophilus]QQK08209.1 TRAP transporter large permease subunit [Miniphocaeibacter halophilus]
MELGTNALINSPSLWGLIPLLIYIVLIFMNQSNLVATLVGIFVGAIITGQSLGMMADNFAASLGSSVAIIGFIIMLGSGLGKLMNRSGITKTLVYWIVKRIGVDTQSKAKLVIIIVSIVICGLLGTLGGGNAVVAPIIIPILATVGITPSAASLILKNAGEVGLIWGPLTGVTLMSLKVTGLSYGRFMLFAAIPFGVLWLIGTWIGANRVQKQTVGTESYEITEDMKVENNQSTKRENIATIIFLLTFIALVVYGILAEQGTSYAILVMVVLIVVVSIVGGIKPKEAETEVISGVASMAELFLIFVTIDVLLNLVTVAGGFEALANFIENAFNGIGATSVMLISSITGGLGIEAAAVSEIQIISDMFGEMARNAKLPMEMFAISLLAATRLTGSIYPTSNLVGQMGIAHSSNMKKVLQGNWISIVPVVIFIIVWAFVGVKIL